MKLGNAATHPAISRTLLLAIAASLFVVVATGIALDKGRALGMAQAEIVSTAEADKERVERREREWSGELTEEVHEFFANFLMLVVAVHVAYLLAFKRPIALFMLFLEPRRDTEKH